MQRIHLHHLHSIWQLLAPASISTPAGERSSASHAVPDSLPPCASLTSPAHSTQHTAHCTQHPAHSTQHTTHNTQHTAPSMTNPCRNTQRGTQADTINVQCVAT